MSVCYYFLNLLLLRLPLECCVGGCGQVPSMLDKSEWKLGGQSFSITLPLTDTVSVIKAKVYDELGMPAGKQKLQLDGLFMKDSNTLAFYNFTPMCAVQLQVKERGGRKK